MLIDNVTITVAAGKGGKGAVAFSKTKMTLGPTGGSGGAGANVYLEAVTDLGALRHFRTKKTFAAPDGEDGRQSFRDGHGGKDLILTVPRGTVARNLAGKTDRELTKIGERICIAKGGHGGKGNFHFKSSTNTSPKQSQPGLPGETCTVHLELKLIADIGLIGLPNVGKSSFLNAVTNAQSRVANYAFTTLEPHLGAYYTLILADLPGLIEGASAGKGLGIKFLKHIERTRILFHFVDAESEHPVRDYDIIRAELGAYNAALLAKPEYIFVTKTDIADAGRIAETARELTAHARGAEVYAISTVAEGGLTAAKKLLTKIMEGIESPA
jgi:GTP-binding protein